MKKNNKKGFTLIELIVVIAILAILAAILIPSIVNYITEANKARDLTNARSIYTEVTLKLNTGTTVASGNYTSGSTTCVVSVTGTTVNSVTCNGVVFTP